MRHATRRLPALTALLVLGAADAQDERHRFSVELELDALETGADTVTDTKLAAAADSEFARAAFVYSGTLRPTLTLDAVVDAVNAGSRGIDLTEAFLTWRPVPRSPLRHELRAGAFYPPLSLENTGPAWTSPYTGSFSAINTWIGEELRTIGAEWSVRRALGPRASQREIRLIAAAYYGNDPAGALLAWRGFALHPRQSRLGDALALPAVPQIQPGMMFDKQAPATEPFVETDHRPGFYAGAEWQLGRRIRLAALHYDNRADPLTIKDGHYGWTTRFDHLGAMLELPAGLGLILQWMDGTTVMGPVMNGAHVVDAGFESYFALLTRKHGRHRWSVRFDDFAVTDRDTIPLDDNGEAGQALAAAYRYEPEGSWSAGLEWLALEVERPAFAYFARPVSASENVVRVFARYRLFTSAD